VFLDFAGWNIAIVGTETLPRRRTRLPEGLLLFGFVTSPSSPMSPFSHGVPFGQSGICPAVFAPDTAGRAMSAVMSATKQEVKGLFML
jgi:hypothetical protein